MAERPVGAGSESAVVGEASGPQVTGHTPGPWEVRRAPNGERCIIQQGVANPLAGIAWTSPPAPGFSEEVVEANARLIAAAPDLLAALVALVEEHLVTTFPPYAPGESPYDIAREAIDKARA